MLKHTKYKFLYSLSFAAFSCFYDKDCFVFGYLLHFHPIMKIYFHCFLFFLTRKKSSNSSKKVHIKSYTFLRTHLHQVKQAFNNLELENRSRKGCQVYQRVTLRLITIFSKYLSIEKDRGNGVAGYMKIPNWIINCKRRQKFKKY